MAVSVLLEHCVSEKQAANSYKTSSGIRTAELLEIVHSDVGEPMQKESMGGCICEDTFNEAFVRRRELHWQENKDATI